MAQMAVPVILVNGRGCVYDMDDARKLRVECRLVGCMIGDKREKREEDGCLPFMLSGEEMALGLRKGWIVLRERDTIRETGSLRMKELSNDSVTIPITKGEMTERVPEWRYPQSFDDRLRCAIFEDIHSKGYPSAMIDAFDEFVLDRYYLTGGIKFGGDWLAYPGDPLMYHAQFIVRVENAERVMQPTFFVAAAREAHSARKHLLYAFSEQNKEGEIKPQYVSITPRDGFGQTDRKKRKQ